MEEENVKMKIIITNHGIENRYLKKERSDKDEIITKLNEKLLDHRDKQSKGIQSRNNVIDIKYINGIITMSYNGKIKLNCIYKISISNCKYFNTLKS